MNAQRASAINDTVARSLKVTRLKALLRWPEKGDAPPEYFYFQDGELVEYRHPVYNALCNRKEKEGDKL